MFFITRFLSFNHSHADLFHKVEQNQRQHLNDYTNAIKSLKKTSNSKQTTETNTKTHKSK